MQRIKEDCKPLQRCLTGSQNSHIRCGGWRETHSSAWCNAIATSEVQVAELGEAVHGVQRDPRTLCSDQRPHRPTGPSHLYMQEVYFARITRYCSYSSSGLAWLRLESIIIVKSPILTSEGTS